MSEQTSESAWDRPTHSTPVKEILAAMDEIRKKYSMPLIPGPAWNCAKCGCESTPISVTAQFYLYKCHCGMTWATSAMQTKGVEEPIIPREVLARLITDAELRMREKDGPCEDAWKRSDARTEAKLARSQWHYIWTAMKEFPQAIGEGKPIIAANIARQAADLTAYLAFLVHHVHEESGLKWTAPWEGPEPPNIAGETVSEETRKSAYGSGPPTVEITEPECPNCGTGNCLTPFRTAKDGEGWKKIQYVCTVCKHGYLYQRGQVYPGGDLILFSVDALTGGPKAPETSPGVGLTGQVRELTEWQDETEHRMKELDGLLRLHADTFGANYTRLRSIEKCLRTLSGHVTALSAILNTKSVHVAELRRKMENIETAESAVHIKVKDDGRILVCRELDDLNPPALEYLTWTVNASKGEAYYAFRRDMDGATFFDSHEDVRAGITLWHTFGRKAFA